VLAFFGIQPGMHALDLFSGGGYYTELLAIVVGPTGRVIAHNNSSYLSGNGDLHAQRYGDPQRLPNVERLDAEAIARKAMDIAADICVYTNHNLVIEKL